MKITDVEVLCLRGLNEHEIYGRSYGAVIRVSTDAGITGYGESDSMPSVIKAVVEAPYINEWLSGLRVLLIGRDPTDTDGLWARMSQGVSNYGRDGATRHAMAAIDIALWDIKGKAAGHPVVELLGGARRDEVRVYATHFLGRSLEETSGYASSLVDAGFSAVKFGWHPLGPDADQDEAIIESLRRCVGASVEVLIDAGNAWDAPTAIERWKRFAPYDIYWLEEPLPAYDMTGYAELTANVDGRITAGELSSSHEELGRLIAEGGVRTVQVDLSRTGITQAMKVAAIAERHEAACVPRPAACPGRCSSPPPSGQGTSPATSPSRYCSAPARSFAPSSPTGHPQRPSPGPTSSTPPPTSSATPSATSPRVPSSAPPARTTASSSTPSFGTSTRTAGPEIKSTCFRQTSPR